MSKEISDELDAKKVEQQQIEYFEDEEEKNTYFCNLKGRIKDGIEQAKKCFNGEDEDWRTFFEFMEEQFENGVSLGEMEKERKKQFPNSEKCITILYPILHAKYVQMPHELKIYIVKKKAGNN